MFSSEESALSYVNQHCGDERIFTKHSEELFEMYRCIWRNRHGCFAGLMIEKVDGGKIRVHGQIKHTRKGRLVNNHIDKANDELSSDSARSDEVDNWM